MKLLLKVLISLTSLLFFLIQIEFALRLFKIPRKELVWSKYMISEYQPDSLLIYRVRPNLNIPWLTTDSNGFKTDSHIRNDVKKVILVIGDSFVWGNTDFAYTYPQLLENLLSEKGLDFRVINAGVSGYGIDQEYILFNQEFDEIKPTIVIWNINLNDFLAEYQHSLFVEYKDHFFQIPAILSGKYWAGVFSQLLPQFIYNKSLLTNFILSKVQNISLFQFKSEEEIENWSIRKAKFLLTKADRKSKENGIKLYLFIVPNQSIIENHSDKEKNVRLLYKITHNLKNLHPVDMNKRIQLSIENSYNSSNLLGAQSPNQSYFLDEHSWNPIGNWHPNELGNRKMAESAAETIVLDTIVSEFSF